MRSLIFITMLVLIAGCSKMDRQQALDDCKFDAVKAKQSESEQGHYAYSCMKAKGYSLSGNQGCSDVYTILPECWDYSWRVFLH